jgi:hypothetical protein
MTTVSKSAAEQLALDAFSDRMPLIMRGFKAERVSGQASGRWICSYDMDCFEGAFCDEPSHGGYLEELEVSDDELAELGAHIDSEGKLDRLSFDELRTRAKIVRQADELAERAHSGQRRKHGPAYIEHPRNVARRIWETSRGIDLELVAAALLHDVVEDTPVTALELSELFGPRVAALVSALTRSKETPREAYFAALASKSRDAVALKVSDRTSNVRDLVLQENGKWAREYLDETERYIAPLAETVDTALKEDFESALEAARAHWA